MSKPNHQIRKVFSGTRLVISKGILKRSTLILRKAELEYWKGTLYQTFHSSTSFRYYWSDTNILSLIDSKEDPLLYELTLTIDKKHKIYFTKHLESLIEVIAYLGGLSRGISFFFLFLIFPIREMLYYRKLMNTIFNICRKEDHIKVALMTMGNELLDKDQRGKKNSKEVNSKGPDQTDHMDDVVDQLMKTCKLPVKKKRIGIANRMILDKAQIEEKFISNFQKSFVNGDGNRANKVNSLANLMGACFSNRVIEKKKGEDVACLLKFEADGKVTRGHQMYDYELRFGEGGAFLDLEPNELAILGKESVKRGLDIWRKRPSKIAMVKEPFGVHLDIDCIKQTTSKRIGSENTDPLDLE